MDIELAEDGMICVKDVSRALSQKDILELIAEHFHEEMADGTEYIIAEVKEVDNDDFTNWFLIPRSLMGKRKKGIK